MFGLFIGDSVGSYLENSLGINDAEEVKKAMSMIGGGDFEVCPGQGTDDTEFALSLMHALLAGQGEFDMEEITRWYGKYFASPVFTYGPTSYKAL